MGLRLWRPRRRKGRRGPWGSDWLVGWLVGSYTDPPFGMQGSLSPRTTLGPGSKLAK